METITNEWEKAIDQSVYEDKKKILDAEYDNELQNFKIVLSQVFLGDDQDVGQIEL